MKLPNNKGKSLYILMLITYVAVLLPFIKKGTPDNDLYFLANTGKYILQNGFPHINPFCITQGLNIVIQNWMCCVLVYLTYCHLGLIGLMILGVSYMILNTYMQMRIIKLYTDSYLIQLILIVVNAITTINYYNLRGTALTMSLLLLEVELLIRYERSGRKKYIVPVPLIAWVIANWQAAYCLFVPILMLPFLMPKQIIDLVINTARQYRTNKEYYLTLIGTFLISAIIPVANPYGTGAVLYSINAAGSMSLRLVNEHKEVSFICTQAPLLLMGVILTTIYLYKKKEHSDLRILFLYIGTAVISFYMSKNAIFVLFALPIEAVVLDDIKNDIKKGMVWRKVYKVFAPQKATMYIVTVTLMLTILTAALIILPFTVFSRSDGTVDCQYTPLDAKEYLDKCSIAKSRIKILSSFNNGGYFEWNGYKVYIDARPEIYDKKINGKENIFSNMADDMTSPDKLRVLIEKYQFTHVFALKGSTEYYFMMNEIDGYRPVLVGNNREYQLFERKERKYKTKNKTISPLPDERGKILIDQVFVQK